MPSLDRLRELEALINVPEDCSDLEFIFRYDRGLMTMFCYYFQVAFTISVENPDLTNIEACTANIIREMGYFRSQILTPFMSVQLQLHRVALRTAPSSTELMNLSRRYF
jgi:hypothetical protein